LAQVELARLVKLATRMALAADRVAQQHLIQCWQAEAQVDRLDQPRQEQAVQAQCRQTLEEQRAHRGRLESWETQVLLHPHRRSEGQAVVVLAV
jgi:hypothetical protein